MKFTGIFITNTFLANFVLSNSTYSHAGFVLMIDVSFVVNASASMVGPAVSVQPSFSNWKVGVTAITSAVGTINVQTLSGAISIYLELHPPVAQPVQFSPPAGSYSKV